MPTIDFSSGYRDATKGATLKALQKRQDDQAAATALAMKPREIGSMWQGAAQIGDVISGSIREGRLANQEAAGRARFAELLAGGLAPDEVGEAMGLDPETTMKFQERNWAQEDLLKQRGWSVEDAERRIAADKEAQQAVFAHADTTLEKTQTFNAGQQDDQQAAAAELAEKADKAAIVLADHNATIEQKQAAQRVIDEAAAAKKLADARIEEAKTSAKTASDLATQNAAQGDEMAKIALAEKARYITPEVAQQRRDALNLKARKDSQGALAQENDKKFASESLAWKGGGMDSVKKNLIDVQNAINILNEPGALESVPVVGGALQSVSDALGFGKSGAGTALLPDSMQNFVNEKGLTARDSIRTAVQESLKAVLGSQYTEKEGENLMNRAFAPGLGPKENARRAGLIKDQLEAMATAKQAMVNYADEHGTLEGYTGPQLDINALHQQLETLAASGGDTAAPEAAAAPSEEDIVETMRANNMTREQVIAEFNRRQGGG